MKRKKREIFVFCYKYDTKLLICYSSCKTNSLTVEESQYIQSREM